MEVLMINKSKKIGRPTAEPKSAQVVVRLSDEMNESLSEFCNKIGKKRSDIVRLAIKEYLEKNS